MIQANTNNRWARLSQSEKAELLGIYTRAGYNDLASIIAHYNSCGGKLHGDGGPEGELKPSFGGEIRQGKKWTLVDRYLADNPQIAHGLRKTGVLIGDAARVLFGRTYKGVEMDPGKMSDYGDIIDNKLHNNNPNSFVDRMSEAGNPLGAFARAARPLINNMAKEFPNWEWSPKIKRFNDSLIKTDRLINMGQFIDDFATPVEQFGQGGTIHIKKKNRGKFTALKERTGHSASWFKEHGTPAQKKMAVFALNSRKWGNRKDEGGENLIAEYPEGYNGELRQGKSFNAWDRYLSNHPMVGHRLRKAKTLLLDAARVHPLTSFATDVYDSYVGPQDESDKITTPLSIVGRGGDIILNTVKQAGEIEPNMKKVFGRSAYGRLLSLPDFIDDSLKFVRDFAEPVTSFENGGYLLGHVYDLSEEQVNELIRQGYEVERV